MAEVTVDDLPLSMIDEYAPHRMPGTMCYESPVLPRGEHTFKLVVNGQTNPKSKYYWVTCDFVEIDD
jgi:hypothetical protein